MGWVDQASLQTALERRVGLPEQIRTSAQGP